MGAPVAKTMKAFCLPNTVTVWAMAESVPPAYLTRSITVTFRVASPELETVT